MSNCGCPYSVMNMQTLNEECIAGRKKVLDDRDSEQGVICSFEFETCPRYLKAIANKEIIRDE